MSTKRLETARLFHRFAFGPRPGEFAAAIRDGVPATRSKLLAIRNPTPNSQASTAPTFVDLGRRPKPNTPEIIEFAVAKRLEIEKLTLWWLDQMCIGENTLEEKMVWFWHGHWATSLSKVDYALPMFNQIQTLRQHSLGDFSNMAQSMVEDVALQFWLDGQVSTVKSPNENLARELMELFTLGVNRYSEDDVKELSRVLTGYQVKLSAGEITFNPRRHDNGVVKLLGSSGVMSPRSAVDLLVQRDDCAEFIAERLWYRYISSTEALPSSFAPQTKFASREIHPLISAMADSAILSDPKYAMVKSPVEWFISACRALELLPSQLDSFSRLSNFLNKLGQTPLYPPNVGGWPTGEAWLSSASSQYRITFASWLVKQSDLQPLQGLQPAQLISASADWLGVAKWSPRTQAALRNTASNLPEFVVLALCSPEYVVSA
jgi:uncharacterized protein (DUF1800 family)